MFIRAALYTSLMLLLVCTFIACGDDASSSEPDTGTISSNDATTSDAGDTSISSDSSSQETGEDTNSSGVDTSQSDTSQTDTAQTDTGDPLPAGCDRGGFSVDDASATRGATSLSYRASSNPGAPHEVLLFGLYGDSTAPGSYNFADVSYRDCTTCLVIGEECDENDACDRLFLATSGDVEVIETTDALRLELSGVEAVEVTMDSDLVTTAVPGGETWCLDEAFEAPLTVDPCAGWPSSQVVQSTCGAAPFVAVFDVSAFVDSWDSVDSTTFDYGDGSVDYDLAVGPHEYVQGDYEGEVTVVGVTSNVQVTINIPVVIRAH